MENVSIIHFMEIGDERGQLISLEEQKNIPFNIKRIYYIYGNDTDFPRGFHAHYNLEQVAICLKGSVRFVIDDGFYRESVTLDRPNIGLYIQGLKWREMYDFSNDCLLMVVASELYDESDYIRDYNEFKKEIVNYE
ncbi:FdtA/QdtA family cupin domain-containing protein [Vibrio scophthalmi]|uniref:sugar 3,4-ketoisomerase n=1 Tax=Vibrio scophthalmi TaxID=45658 RepID=UPI00349F230C